MKYLGYISFLLLAACTPVAVEPTPPAPEVVKPQAAEILAAQQKQQRLVALLALGQQALAQGRLMTPAEDSAYKWYRQALDVDELNEQAHRGMRQITAQYMELAEQAFKEQRHDTAELMMSRAMKVSATPQQCHALRARYPEQQPRENEFVLSRSDLGARNAVIVKRLDSIARQAREKQSRLTIVARNDAEGRWIYKQMRSAVDGYRLRGNIAIGGRPKVVLIDLDGG